MNSKENENDKMIMVALVIRIPRNGRFRYSPSRFALQYRKGDEITTAPCLAVGKIYKTDDGIGENWVVRGRESKKITRTTMGKDDMLKIHTLFELPKDSRDYELRSHDY